MSDETRGFVLGAIRPAFWLRSERGQLLYAELLASPRIFEAQLPHHPERRRLMSSFEPVPLKQGPTSSSSRPRARLEGSLQSGGLKERNTRESVKCGSSSTKAQVIE